MFEMLLIWLALLTGLIAYGLIREPRGGGLALSYFLGLSLIHIPGVLPFLTTSYVPERDETSEGLALTLVGMAAFVAACVAGRLTIRPRPLRRGVRFDLLERYGWRALAFGVVTYFVIAPIGRRVSSLEALISPLGAMLVVGLWLRLYSAHVHRNTGRTYQTLALLPLLPLATLSTAGFIGYGVNWSLSVVSFVFSLSRRRIGFYVAAPLVAYLGLSFFVAYMGERTGIRDLVWNENAGMAQRLERISEIVTNFEPLNLTSDRHIQALEERLNQNYLVGVGIDRLKSGEVGLQYGGTFPAWNLIPRAVWPDKPEIGGGGDVVSAFTGINFAEGTSVGAGQVLEFDMNFGIAGVVVGFALLGFALTYIDARIATALRDADIRSLLRWAMPGLALISPGGNLSEIIVSCVGAAISAQILTATPLFGASPRQAPMQPGLPAPDHRRP